MGSAALQPAPAMPGQQSVCGDAQTTSSASASARIAESGPGLAYRPRGRTPRAGARMKRKKKDIAIAKGT